MLFTRVTLACSFTESWSCANSGVIVMQESSDSNYIIMQRNTTCWFCMRNVLHGAYMLVCSANARFYMRVCPKYATSFLCIRSSLMPLVHVENKKYCIKLQCQSRPDLAFELCVWKREREESPLGTWQVLTCYSKQHGGVYARSAFFICSF